MPACSVGGWQDKREVFCPLAYGCWHIASER